MRYGALVRRIGARVCHMVQDLQSEHTDDALESLVLTIICFMTLGISAWMWLTLKISARD